MSDNQKWTLNDYGALLLIEMGRSSSCLTQDEAHKARLQVLVNASDKDIRDYAEVIAVSEAKDGKNHDEVYDRQVAFFMRTREQARNTLLKQTAALLEKR